MVIAELQLDLESFLSSECVKIQDECTQQAVNKVIGASSDGRDSVQQLIDSWSRVYLQV